MLKKVIIAIAVAVVLIGAENLSAVEKCGNPKAEQKQKCQAKKKHNKKAGRKHMRKIQQKHQGFRPGQNRRIQERFDKWFNELVKAHRQNDREGMGRLLRKMHQTRQEPQEARDTIGHRRRDFRNIPGAGRRRAQWFGGELGRRGQGFRGRGMGRGGRVFQHRGMGRYNRGFRRRGMNVWR